jgi:hypothetical protein
VAKKSLYCKQTRVYRKEETTITMVLSEEDLLNLIRLKSEELHMKPSQFKNGQLTVIIDDDDDEGVSLDSLGGLQLTIIEDFVEIEEE